MTERMTNADVLKSLRGPTMTDGARILSKLRAARGEWVENLYGTTACMVHSRIAELRRRGFVIECRRFGQGDYRYRLVAEPETTEVR